MMLQLAEELLRMGLSVTEVIEGYEQACEKAIEFLPGNLIDLFFDCQCFSVHTNNRSGQEKKL